MRDWGKLSTRFWKQGSGKRLRGDHAAQVAALYLIGCDWANSIGIFYVPLSDIAHHMGSPLEGAMEALRRGIEAGFCEYDLASEMVWIPNHAEIEIGKELKPKDNRKQSVQQMLEALGNHPYAAKFWDRYGEAYGLTKPKPLASPFEGPWKPLPSQSKSKARAKQEQIQIGASVEKLTELAHADFEHRGELLLTAPSAPVSQPKRKRDISPERQAEAKAIKSVYCAEYLAKYGKYPPWGAREWRQLYDLMGSWVPSELLRLVPLFFVWRNQRAIQSGHQWGKGPDCFVLKAGELDADVHAPERRKAAAIAQDRQKQDDHNATTEDQAARVAAMVIAKHANRQDPRTVREANDPARSLLAPNQRPGAFLVDGKAHAVHRPGTGSGARRGDDATDDADFGRLDPDDPSGDSEIDATESEGA